MGLTTHTGHPTFRKADLQRTKVTGVPPETLTRTKTLTGTSELTAGLGIRRIEPKLFKEVIRVDPCLHLREVPLESVDQ